MKSTKPDISFSQTVSLKKEFARKLIHLTVAFTPVLANFNYLMTVILLVAGILIYVYSEGVRLSGGEVPVITKLTRLASRERDKGGFVLGALTLGIGALLALLLYPSPASEVALYALAFGDGLASLAGKLWGRVKIPFLHGKSWAGSITCFIAVLISTFIVTGVLWESIIIAVSATLLEMIPVKDWDNIIIPVGTGLIATLIF